MYNLIPKRKPPPVTLSLNFSYVERYWKHQHYLQHRKNVANIKPRVDNKAPRLPYHLYIQNAKLHTDNENALRIQRENKQILMKINEINRTKGGLDSFWDKYPKVVSSKYWVRREEAEAITKANFRIHKRIKEKGPYYSHKQLEKEYQENLKYLRHASYYASHTQVSKNNKKSHVPSIQDDCTVCNRPYRCFFDIEVEGDKKLGRIIFQVYADIVPKTAFNFLAICKGLAGLSYKGCVFHRIKPGLLCQGGDMVKGNGSGGLSVYGPSFPDENFLLSHGGAGILSMANSGPDTNNSIFNITFRPLLTLNGKCVVIGKVEKGLEILYEMQDYGTTTGRPRKKVFIADCGLLWFK